MEEVASSQSLEGGAPSPLRIPLILVARTEPRPPRGAKQLAPSRWRQAEWREAEFTRSSARCLSFRKRELPIGGCVECRRAHDARR